MKANNAFTYTLLDVDLKYHPRLKKKILRSFERYKEETKALLMCMKSKNKDLQDELEDQNLEVERLKIKLAKEQEEMCKNPKELEETRGGSIGLKTQLAEDKRI